ncbi:hypothetical protein Gotur_014959 [Gossypium turneri]
MNDLISKLPRQPDVNFRQFAGYTDVNENVVGRSLFYYFVEVEKDPLTQPLTVWLTGGHFVPNLANALHDDNKQSKFNLKGLILGNPMLRKKLDDIAKIDFFFSREMINSSLYNEIKKECNAIDEKNYFSSIKTTWSAKCKNFVFEADLAALKTDAHNYSPQKLFDIFRPPCAETEQDLNLGKQGTLQHLKKLAEELNIKLTKEETWSFRTKEGGLKYEFGDLLKFLTMKGGNHHVTSSRPSQAFSISQISQLIGCIEDW